MCSLSLFSSFNMFPGKTTGTFPSDTDSPAEPMVSLKLWHEVEPQNATDSKNQQQLVLFFIIFCALNVLWFNPD